MQQIGPVISASTNLAVMYAERLLSGVKPEIFARFARPGGQIVASNHAAFVFGHLALYPARAMDMLRQPRGATEYPPNYETLFKNGVECRDDADGKLYPPMAELTRRCLDGYRAAAAAVLAADDARLLEPNPAEGRMKDLFPTVGAALNFYLSGHVQSHLGQVSAWRRAWGLPAA